MDNQNDTEVLNQDDDFTSQENQDDSNESDTSSQFTPRERQLYARLQREKERNKELEELVAQPTETNQKQERSPNFEEKLELIAKGYQDEEIAFIQKNGGVKALKDQMVMDALKIRRDKIEANEKAVNNISSKSGVSTKYTESQIAKMSASEYAEKILKQ